jgi:recombinational DNA repair ATPase RecF
MHLPQSTESSPEPRRYFIQTFINNFKLWSIEEVAHANWSRHMKSKNSLLKEISIEQYNEARALADDQNYLTHNPFPI